MAGRLKHEKRSHRNHKKHDQLFQEFMRHSFTHGFLFNLFNLSRR